MTSISGGMSPSDIMKAALQSAVSSGTVKSADQSALSSALTDIDTALKASKPSTSGTDPDSMQTKVSSLIDSEVSDGKLTDDQADELKQVFAQAQQQMAAASPPPPPPGDTSTAGTDAIASITGTSASTSTSSTDAASGTSSNDDAVKALVSFLKQLDQSTSSSSIYGAGGASASTASTASALLVDTAA